MMSEVLKGVQNLEESGWTCEVCTYLNGEGAQKCEVCGGPHPLDLPPQQLIDNVEAMEVNRVLPPLQHQKEESAMVTVPLIQKGGLKCPRCRKQNQVWATDCVYCEELLSDYDVCYYCQVKVRNSLAAAHIKGCQDTEKLLEEEKVTARVRQLKIEEQHQKIRVAEELTKNREERLKFAERQAEQMKELKKRATMDKMDVCDHCSQCMEKTAMKHHEDQCGRLDIEIGESRVRLTPLQLKALQHMYIHSRTQQTKVKEAFKTRFAKLGYSAHELSCLQHYFRRQAPIIIHIHISKHMQFFVKDRYYRSQFETNKSSGSLSRPSRIQWEDRMFFKNYNAATDFERVKYGVMNFFNDPKGVNSCVSYGQSYFLLKPHVRERCTFTDKDSSCTDAAIGTFKYPLQVLSKMNDQEIKTAVQAAKALQGSSNCPAATYKEIQIHGPLEFDLDIERVYANRKELTPPLQLLLDEFCTNHRVPCEYF